MKKTYVLHFNYDDHITKRIYEWKLAEEYRTDDYVLITDNDKPMELLVPVYCRDMGASWYEHKNIKLYKFKWVEDIIHE